MNLRAKLLLIVALPLLLVYSMYIATDYTKGREHAVATARANLWESISQRAALLDARFSRMAAMADTLAGLLAERKAGTLGQLTLVSRTILLENPDVTSATLAYKPNAFDLGHPFFSTRVQRMDWDGKEVFLTHEALDDSYTKEGWFSEPARAHVSRWTEPYLDTNQYARLMCTYSSPLLTNGVFHGVLAVDTSVEHITQVLSSLSLPGGYSVLVSSTGTILSHPDPSLIAPLTLKDVAEKYNLRGLAAFATHIESGGDGGIVFAESTALLKNAMVGYSRVPSTGWYLIGAVEEDAILAPVITRLRNNMLQLAGSAVLIFLLIFFLASRQITRPLHAMAQTARRIASGDLDTPVPVLRQQDEIGDLARAFHTMQTSLHEHIGARVAESTARKMAEDANLAKTEFISNMSHELRTPLNAIAGMTYLALNTQLNPQQEKYLRQIQDSARAMQNLITDVFDFSAMDAGKLILEPAPFELEAFLHSASADFPQRAKDKGLFFKMDIARDAPRRLVGDTRQLERILRNLFSNAVKFTEKGGVHLECGPDFAFPCRISADVALRFTVRDTGVGIPAEYREQMFVPFSQADGSTTRRHGGMGLGLTIVHRLVQLMDGVITVDSAPLVGTSINVTLCFKKDAPAASKASTPAPKAAPLPDPEKPAATRPDNSPQKPETNLWLADALVRLEALLQDDDAHSAVVFAELGDALRANQPDEYEQLAQAMNSFAFDQALTVARTARERLAAPNAPANTPEADHA